MKKYLRLLVVSVLLIGLTGCVSLDTNVVVNKDKSMEFSMKEEIDLSSMTGDEGDENATVSDETDIEALKTKGYTVEEYDNEGVKGYKISKKFTSIDEVTAKNGTETPFVVEKWLDDGNDSNMFSLKDGVYSANWIMAEDDKKAEEMDGVDSELLNSLINITYTITLPNKPLSHNATSVSEDGKTLTYLVKYDENQKMNTIKFSFDFATEPTKATSTEIDNMLYYIIGGSALIVIILVVVIISIVKGKNKKVHIDEIKQEETEKKDETALNKVENVVEPVQTTQHNIPTEPRPMPQQGSVQQPRPMPQQGGVQQLRPMPQQGGVQQPRPMPQQGGVQQPRPIPQQGNVQQPRPMPQQGGVQQPRPMPQQGGVQQPRPMPQQGSVQQPRPMPQQGNVQQPRPMPQQGSVQQPRPMPQQGNVQQPRPMSQQGGVQQPRPMPQQGNVQQPRPVQPEMPKTNNNQE